MACFEIDKQELIEKLEYALNKKLAELDTVGLFEHHKNHKLVKGIAGDVIEQGLLGYPANSDQEPDLLVIENGTETKWELKTTGILKREKAYVAKEPMSITAVGIDTITEQTFFNSHFWDKLENLLIIYYLHSGLKVSAYDYKDFPVKGYDFHQFSAEDIETLQKDWKRVYEHIKSLEDSIDNYSRKNSKNQLIELYRNTPRTFKRELSYIDLAPSYPPRFRLRKPYVNLLVAKTFGNTFEMLSKPIKTLSEIEIECLRLTEIYKGKTIREIFESLGVHNIKDKDKGIGEKVVIAMFGGKATKLNKIEVFAKFGVLAKTIKTTPKGKRTEDMKLFKIDFKEIITDYIQDEFSEDGIRPYTFEDSEIYSYFADYNFLFIKFEEPEIKGNLMDNKFIGFKLYRFSEDFIQSTVKNVWKDIRNKIIRNELRIVQKKNSKTGETIVNKSGSIKESPNFIKSSENEVFVRGGTANSSDKYKTEIVNGLKMVPQYIWIKGSLIAKIIEDIK